MIFDAVVRVDTFNGCDRFSVRSGRGGREVGVVAKVVEADEPTTVDEDGGGIDGIGMCFNICLRVFVTMIVISAL